MIDLRKFILSLLIGLLLNASVQCATLSELTQALAPEVENHYIALAQRLNAFTAPTNRTRVETTIIVLFAKYLRITRGTPHQKILVLCSNPTSSGRGKRDFGLLTDRVSTLPGFAMVKNLLEYLTSEQRGCRGAYDGYVDLYRTPELDKPCSAPALTICLLIMLDRFFAYLAENYTQVVQQVRRVLPTTVTDENFDAVFKDGSEAFVDNLFLCCFSIMAHKFPLKEPVETVTVPKKFVAEFFAVAPETRDKITQIAAALIHELPTKEECLEKGIIFPQS